MSKLKSLEYYTPESVANLLVSLVPTNRVSRVLDLCVGSGNLLWAARRKWPSAFLVGVDIDRNAIAGCRRRFAQPATFLCGDARLMHPKTTGKPTQLTDSAFDVVLANPPFAGNQGTRLPVLNESHDLANRNIETLPAKWKFLSQRVEAVLLVFSLLYVRPGGYLAAIIPDSILSCDRFMTLRDWLIQNSQRLIIIKLPHKSFNNTEVAASALILKRAECPKPDARPSFILQEAKSYRDKLSRNILYRGTINGSCNRLDTACIPSSYAAAHTTRLADLASIIKRGTFIPKQNLDVTGSSVYIHSIHIKSGGLDITTTPRFINTGLTESEVAVECGDILLVRVGKTLGKVAIVTNDEQKGFISSCLYQIRPKGIDSYSLALLLQSRSVQDYYRKIARGSAAKFLTYSDIHATPISLVLDGFLKVLAAQYRELLDSKVTYDIKNSDRMLAIKRLLNEVDSGLDALKVG